MGKLIRVLIIAAMLPILTGCGIFIKPYKTPILEEFESNETVFMVPLEGDTGQQAKFSSIEMLEEMKISVKRIEMPQRWVQMGRLPAHGKWIPAAKVIKVNRSPVARRWTPETGTGTSDKFQGLSAESKDSIGVTSGFAITAYIKEQDSAKFLYYYPNTPLKDVIDSQIFNAAQAVYTAWAAKYELDELRQKKEEITLAMRDELIPKFAEMGITIDQTMGLIGGLYYENKDIQMAIDKVFMAQTLEEKNDAERRAQVKENERQLSIEETEAARRKVKADAEAYEISKKAEAVKTGGDAYIRLLELEVERARIAKWDGSVPQFSGGTGGGGVIGHVVAPLPVQ